MQEIYWDFKCVQSVEYVPGTIYKIGIPEDCEFVGITYQNNSYLFWYKKLHVAKFGRKRKLNK